MSRLSQSYAYLNAKTSDLTNDWVKTNLTDIKVTDSLKELRKAHLKKYSINKAKSPQLK